MMVAMTDPCGRNTAVGTQRAEGEGEREGEIEIER